MTFISKYDRFVTKMVRITDQDSYVVKQQKKYLFTFIVLGICTLLPFYVITQLLQQNYNLFIADFLLLSSATLTLYFLRINKTDTALLTMVITLIAKMILITVLTDITSDEPVSYLRLLETSLDLVVLSVAVGMFTSDLKKLTRYVLFYSIIIIIHYVVLILKIDGNVFELNYYLAWSLIMLAMTYVMSRVVFKVNATALFISQVENKKLAVMIDEKVNELAESNKTKDKFFSIIAHDLKGPIGASWQLSKYLCEMEDKDPELIMKHTCRMSNDLGILYQLMENLLLWAKSQSNLMVFNPEDVNLKDVVDDSIRTLNSYACNKGIAIINNLPESLIVHVDKLTITTVFRNLISNAVKFTSKGGEIKLLKVEPTNSSTLTIEVCDNGVGMNQETQEAIFDITGEYTSVGTENEKGTGLGLKLCKEFVERNGGVISCSSIENKGTSFYVTLPVE
ncbi:MAG: HAMP domain-containing histidine kinase [Bacteroidales bacterium]|nr:HAMP domain-containing histidine kinase [Bacteroidales bacterium]